MIKYIINKEKRTIVAVINFEDSTTTFKNADWIFSNLYDTLGYLSHRNDMYNKKYYKLEKKMYFPKYMSAKAKCNPEDKWDEELGKTLAHMRLVEKIKNYRNNSYKIISDLNKEIGSILKY